MYEIISEKLGIARCDLEDLTMKQAQHFLKQWESGASIGTLILFYEKEEDLIVLNSSNDNYRAWLEIVEAYLIASEENKEELRKRIYQYSKDIGDILDDCIEYRACKQELFRIKHSKIEEKYRSMIWQIWKEGGRIGSVSIVYKAFTYGMMCGKRKERKKKRQSAKA